MAKKDILNPDEELDLSEGAMDDSLVMNLDDVDESSSYEALPPGIYDCVIENTEYTLSKAGNPMITWTFKVIEPQYEGRFLFNHTVLNNDVGVKRLKQLLVRVFPEMDLSTFRPKVFADNGEAIGRPCRVKVRIQNYQGEKRNSVSDVLAPAEETGGGFLDD